MPIQSKNYKIHVYGKKNDKDEIGNILFYQSIT